MKIRINKLGRYTRSQQHLDSLEAKLAEESEFNANLLAPSKALAFVSHRDDDEEEFGILGDDLEDFGG